MPTLNEELTDAALDAVAEVHLRSVHALAGVGRMADHGGPGSVADRLREIHMRQARTLTELLLSGGRTPDSEGSFVPTAGRAQKPASGARHGDAAHGIRTEEEGVLGAYDAALSQPMPESEHIRLAAMRDELKELVAATRQQDD
jgi:hypothetical protein